MHILIHDYAGHPFQVGLSRELASRGMRVTHAYAGGLLTPRGCLERRDGDPEGLQFVEIPMHVNYRRDKFRFLRRRQHELSYGRRLRRLISGLQPALVISGNTPSEPQWLAVQAAVDWRIPFISWVQDFYGVAVSKLLSRRSLILGWLAGAYYSRLDAKVLRRSAHVVSITEDFIPLLRQHGVRADDISVVENWGALEEMPMLPKDNAWSRAHGLAHACVLMYTGTLALKHNPQRLRELALRYRDQDNVKVVVISEGPSADYLQRCSQRDNLPNLVVRPFQPFAAMPQVLASADVFLALLEPDAGIFSVPSKILTYLCAGRPTLASIPAANLGCRLMARSQCGLAVDPSDVDGWAAAADQLLQDAALRQRMGRAARAYAVEAFDIQGIADKFDAIFARAPVPRAVQQTAPVPAFAARGAGSR